MKQFFTPVVALLIVLMFCSAQAQTSSRLIAQSHYNGSGANLIAFDSTKYFFVNATSALNSQKFTYQYSGTAWVHMRKHDFTYNASGKLTGMVYQNWATATSTYTNGGLTTFFLNAAGYCIKDSNVLWIPANNAYRNNVRNIYTLNAAGQITEQVYDNWDAGINNLLHHFRYVNTYNTMGRPLTILTQDYDASIQWYDHYKTTYAYDATDTNVQTISGKQDVTTPGILENVYQNVMTLNTNGTIASYLSNIWNAASSTYKPSMSIAMTYNSAGDNTLETQQTWNTTTNTYKPYQQFVRTYNTYHQKTSETRMMWNTTTNAYDLPSARDNWYYETYTPSSTTAVTSVNASSAWLSLTPVPTAGQLHIVLNWEEPQAFTAVLVDMTGRICNTFSAPEAKEYKADIDLGNLPNGNYIITIKGNQGTTISRTIMIAR